jgi:hypothetical protein
MALGRYQQAKQDLEVSEHMDCVPVALHSCVWEMNESVMAWLDTHTYPAST